MKLNDRINEILTERKWYHRVTAITIVFSLLCAFIVPFDLVKPGFAETGETETTSDAFTDASADAPTGALDLSTFITNLTIGNQNAVQVTADGTPYQLDVNLNYVISQSAMENAEITDIVNGIPTHPYLTYLISSSDFSLNRDQQYGETCTVMDGSRPAGYYSLKKINDTSARLNIRLTKDYIEYLSQQTNGCTGSVGIGGRVDRAASESGDKDITIAGQTIHVIFPDTELGLNKSALGYQDGKIRWQIELTNPEGYIDLSTVTLDDVLEEGNDEKNVVSGKLSSLVTDPESIFTLDSATGKMTYKGDATLGTYFASCSTAANVADVLATKNFIDDGELTQAFADIVANHLGTAETASFTNSGATSSITGIADGYYLIQDDGNPTNTAAGADNKGARTRFILKVAGENVAVTAKHSAPSVMKKVQEDSIAETAQTVSFAGNASYAAGNGYNDVADYNIGEAVPFKLYGSMPATLADYSAYYYEFSDTLASQFDQPTTATVNVGTTTLTYTWNSTSSKYDVDTAHQLAAVATGSAAETATEYYFNGDSTFIAQVEAAFESDATYQAYTTESEKAQYVYNNWTTFTTAQAAYTAADKDIYIKTKTVVTTPAIVAHDADTTTDGNCRVTWTAGASAGDPGTLAVTFEDIKAYGVTTDSVVTVTYSATLNNTAVIGLDGQQNAVKLVYSSNPNVNYTPDTNDTTDQGATHKSGGNTNDTPEDKVIVFTYELDVNKINSDGSLKGAQFVVYRKNSSNVNEYAKVAANGSGAYRLSEWTTTIPTIKTPTDATNGFTDTEIAAASTDGVFISSGDASKPIVIAGLDDGE